MQGPTLSVSSERSWKAAKIWDINLTKTVARGIRMFSFFSEVKRIWLRAGRPSRVLRLTAKTPLAPLAPRPGLVSAECQRLGCHFPPCCCVAMTTDIEITEETRAGRKTDLVTRWQRCLRFLCGLYVSWDWWVNMEDQHSICFTSTFEQNLWDM